MNSLHEWTSTKTRLVLNRAQCRCRALMKLTNSLSLVSPLLTFLHLIYPNTSSWAFSSSDEFHKLLLINIISVKCHTFSSWTVWTVMSMQLSKIHTVRVTEKCWHNTSDQKVSQFVWHQCLINTCHFNPHHQHNFFLRCRVIVNLIS